MNPRPLVSPLASAPVRALGVLALLTGCAVQINPRHRVNLRDVPALSYHTIRVYQVKGARSTHTRGVNDGGEAVGTYFSGLGQHRGARFSPDWFYVEYPLNGTAASHYPNDVNNRGDIVGTFRTPYAHGYLKASDARYGEPREIRYPGARDTSALKVNDLRQVLGTYYSRGRFGGFLWRDGKFEDLKAEGARQIVVAALNNRGQVILYADGRPHLRETDGSLTELGDLPPNFLVRGLSDTREMVGLYHSVSNVEHALYRDAAGSFYRIVIPEARGTVPTDISGNQISGYFHHENSPLEQQGFVITF